MICLTIFLFYHITALKTRRAANLGSVNVNRTKVPANHGCEAQGSAVLGGDSEGLQGEPSHIRASVPVAVETIHSLLQHQSGKIMYRDAELCVCHTHTHTHTRLDFSLLAVGSGCTEENAEALTLWGKSQPFEEIMPLRKWELGPLRPKRERPE